MYCSKKIISLSYHLRPCSPRSTPMSQQQTTHERIHAYLPLNPSPHQEISPSLPSQHLSDGDNTTSPDAPQSLYPSKKPPTQARLVPDILHFGPFSQSYLFPQSFYMLLNLPKAFKTEYQIHQAGIAFRLTV